MKKLFSNGTAYCQWINNNCCMCEKYNPEGTKKEDCCDLEYEIAMACCGDGTMDQKYVDRIGGFDGLFLANCKEKNRDIIPDNKEQLKFERIIN